MRFAVALTVLVLTGCAVFEPAPTAVPTHVMTGPTLAASPVFRGEVPTEAPTQVLGANDPTAAAMPSGGNLPPLPVATGATGDVKQTIRITAADGSQLTGDLYSQGDQRQPGILMLAPDSEQWLDLPLRLQAAGFTVLTMNTRDARNLGVFNSVLHSLVEAGQVDPGRVAVVGAEAGAELALNGCAVEALCDAVALISPTERQALLVAMQNYNPRPVFLAAGEDDAAALETARALADFAQGDAALELGSGAQRGALLIQANPAIGDRLIDWLREQF